MRTATSHTNHSTSNLPRFVVFVALLISLKTTFAAEPGDYLDQSPRHSLLASDMPPGVVGQVRLSGPGPIAGYFQPVAFLGPEGTEFALAYSDSFMEGSEHLQAGLLVGSVYRFRITGIPGAPGAELYPTIEVIDRTYPPPGLALRYPITISLDQDDFDAALNGQLVTRVIYLEDPQTATPLEQTRLTDRPLEVSEYQEALQVADQFGRPVAIVRLGSVSPPSSPALFPSFFFGSPVWAPIQQPEQAAPTEPVNSFEQAVQQ
jgi:hypothetical protein